MASDFKVLRYQKQLFGGLTDSHQSISDHWICSGPLSPCNTSTGDWGTIALND